MRRILIVILLALMITSLSIVRSTSATSRVSVIAQADDFNNTTRMLVSLITTLVPVMIIMTIILFVLGPVLKTARPFRKSSDEIDEITRDALDELESKSIVASSSEPERVKCDYCESLFVATKLTTECPNCGAPYGESRPRLVDTRDRERALFGRPKK